MSDTNQTATNRSKTMTTNQINALTSITPANTPAELMAAAYAVLNPANVPEAVKTTFRAEMMNGTDLTKAALIGDFARLQAIGDQFNLLAQGYSPAQVFAYYTGRVLAIVAAVEAE